MGVGYYHLSIFDSKQFLIANLFLRIKDNTALRNEENFSIQTYSIQHLILDNDVLAA